MIIYESYPNQTHPESGLVVAIERDGIRAVQMDWVDEDMIGEPGGRWLVLSALFTWYAYHNRYRAYAGDDGDGRVRERVTAAAISLLAYWGGNERLFRRKDSAIAYVEQEMECAGV